MYKTCCQDVILCSCIIVSLLCHTTWQYFGHAGMVLQFLPMPELSSIILELTQFNVLLSSGRNGWSTMPQHYNTSAGLLGWPENNELWLLVIVNSWIHRWKDAASAYVQKAYRDEATLHHREKLRLLLVIGSFSNRIAVRMSNRRLCILCSIRVPYGSLKSMLPLMLVVHCLGSPLYSLHNNVAFQGLLLCFSCQCLFFKN